jgi:hypothetical protein
MKDSGRRESESKRRYSVNPDKYDLSKEDGLLNRKRDLISNQDRIDKLGLVKKVCDGCKVDDGMKACTYVRDGGKKRVLCRICQQCTQCSEMPEECKCSDKPVQKRTPKLFCRKIWRVCTCDGILIRQYYNTKYLLGAVIMSAFISLFLSIESVGVSRVSGNVTPVTTTSPPRDLGLFALDVFLNFLFILSIAMVLQLLLVIERCCFRCNRNELHRLNRLRFEYIESQVRLDDPHADSYSFDYMSDSNEEGMNDPDIAFINFTEPIQPNTYCSC